MQFNSIEFLLFLPLVFLIYWSMHKNRKAQNMFIIVVSYLFYGWWNVKLLFLIALTSFLSHLSGILIEKAQTSNKPLLTFITPKALMVSNVVANLAILGIFKYYNFFIENLVELFATIDINLHLSSLHLILPVGISFYTFQALSYSIDVYNNKINSTKDIIAFFAYVSFFPQLVAGPIERATNLLPQFLHTRSFNYHKAVDGMRQMLWGFFMKVVIADNCANIVNHIYDHYTEASWVTLIIGAFLFTFQIYGDFAGYSNIAIGCSRLFGFDLMPNFTSPYFSSSIPEFWRRWHISLNTWFRDYVYIPLGGSRAGQLKQFRNTILVFGLSGLWHGASWTYVAWGIYHGVLANLYKLRKPRKSNYFAIVFTFILVVIGWILFRAENIAQAGTYCLGIFTLQSGASLTALECSRIQFISTVIFIVILMTCEFFTLGKAHPLINLPKNIFVRWGIYTSIIMMLLFFPGRSETFIYFQF